jgi:hypothetical protein
MIAASALLFYDGLVPLGLVFAGGAIGAYWGATGVGEVDDRVLLDTKPVD